jgi:hypothetical protein
MRTATASQVSIVSVAERHPGRPQQRDDSILSSFDGRDEMEAYGAASAILRDDRLVLTLMYHQGDKYTFEATRRA